MRHRQHIATRPVGQVDRQGRRNATHHSMFCQSFLTFSARNKQLWNDRSLGTSGLDGDINISYSAAFVPVLDDLAAAHGRFWKRLASPGAW